jgi:hypothetical protein
MRRLSAVVAAAVLCGALGVSAQEALTFRGEIVEASCFKKGVAQSTGAAHVACAKDCVQKGQPLGILTEGDGFVKITGDYAANKYAKLLEFIGKQVEVRGSDDRYLDYSRAIKVTSIKLVK